MKKWINYISTIWRKYRMNKNKIFFKPNLQLIPVSISLLLFFYTLYIMAPYWSHPAIYPQYFIVPILLMITSLIYSIEFTIFNCIHPYHNDTRKWCYKTIVYSMLCIIIMHVMGHVLTLFIYIHLLLLLASISMILFGPIMLPKHPKKKVTSGDV